MVPDSASGYAYEVRDSSIGLTEVVHKGDLLNGDFLALPHPLMGFEKFDPIH